MSSLTDDKSCMCGAFLHITCLCLSEWPFFCCPNLERWSKKDFFNEYDKKEKKMLICHFHTLFIMCLILIFKVKVPGFTIMKRAWMEDCYVKSNEKARWCMTSFLLDRIYVKFQTVLVLKELNIWCEVQSTKKNPRFFLDRWITFWCSWFKHQC